MNIWEFTFSFYARTSKTFFAAIADTWATNKFVADIADTNFIDFESHRYYLAIKNVINHQKPIGRNKITLLKICFLFAEPSFETLHY